MAYEHQLKLSIDNREVIFLTVSLEDKRDEPVRFRVSVQRSAVGPAEAEAVWDIIEKDSGFELQLTTQSISSAIGKGICLAGCLAGIVTGARPLVDCLKTARSRDDVEECLSANNAIAQSIGALSCIYGCLNM